MTEEQKNELFEKIDLFENYDHQTPGLKKVLESFDPGEIVNYNLLDQFKNECEKIGFTFDYDLSAQPYFLRPVNEADQIKLLNAIYPNLKFEYKEINFYVNSWTSKNKYECDKCKNLLSNNNGFYKCEPCKIIMKPLMKF